MSDEALGAFGVVDDTEGLVVFVRYRRAMSGRRDESITQLEEQLDEALRTMSGLDQLNSHEIDRVAMRMDRLASQLLEISAPAAMDAVDQRLGVTPVSNEDFASLVDARGAPDGEG
jgi:hypothetical protein